jgi:enterochelin esterase family protein
MRSIEYDTVSDKYANFLRDELLPEVYRKYNIRKDGYSRAIGGASSGGICSFNAAWQQSDQFSRVISWIGSFTSIQWDQTTGVGGHDFPFMIRKQTKRNIRVWLQDGSEDLENTHGSWPLQNLQMANSLKMRGYDFHLSFGNGTHNSAHGSAELPAELIWLWRGYDPAKTSEEFQMDDSEKDKPLFRVRPYSRDK